jgi:hypothetical protein
VARVSSIVAAIVLLLSAVSTSWCAADCVAKTLAPSSCHHEQEAAKVCDDPTTIVPDASLPAPAFAFEPFYSGVSVATPLERVAPAGLFPPSPPLRI